jgi:hypothetical protein
MSFGNLPRSVQGPLELERLRVGRDGYDQHGRYWGRGAPVFLAYDAVGGAYALRAGSMKAARDQIRRKLPGVKFVTGGKVRAVGSPKAAGRCDFRTSAAAPAARGDSKACLTHRSSRAADRFLRDAGMVPEGSRAKRRRGRKRVPGTTYPRSPRKVPASRRRRLAAGRTPPETCASPRRVGRGRSDDWFPASGGSEEPFTTRMRRRLLYVWQPSTGRHAYLDMDRDVILSDEEVSIAIWGNPHWHSGPGDDRKAPSRARRVGKGDKVAYVAKLGALGSHEIVEPYADGRAALYRHGKQITVFVPTASQLRKIDESARSGRPATITIGVAQVEAASLRDERTAHGARRVGRPRASSDRLFVGVFPAGISYAARGREVDGDYARVAFLPYATLALEVVPGADKRLVAAARAHAAKIRARRGEEYPIDACGHTVRLGGRS